MPQGSCLEKSEPHPHGTFLIPKQPPHKPSSSLHSIAPGLIVTGSLPVLVLYLPEAFLSF